MIHSFFGVIFLLLQAGQATEPPSSHAAFFEKVKSQCGAVYEGRSYHPADPEDSFYGKVLVAEIGSCTEGEIRIRFAVGEDHTRTWVLTLSEKGLLFKHDHRHEDGTAEEITNYGGWANTNGTELMQFFPADEDTKTMLPAAATNVWQLAFDPKMNTLIYYLERNNQARFKAVLTLKKSPKK